MPDHLCHEVLECATTHLHAQAELLACAVLPRSAPGPIRATQGVLFDGSTRTLGTTTSGAAGGGGPADAVPARCLAAMRPIINRVRVRASCQHVAGGWQWGWVHMCVWLGGGERDGWRWVSYSV